MRGPFRTQPGAAGAWAHILGAILAMVLPAALGFGLMFGIEEIATPPPALSAVPSALQPLLGTLAVSPAFTWMALVPGIPLAVWAVRRGRAGWAVLALGGGTISLLVATIVGALLYAAWTSALGPGGEDGSVLGGLSGTLTFFAAGVGLCYWLGLRLAAPRLFTPRPVGMPRRA